MAVGRRLQRWTQRCDRCRAYKTGQRGKGLWILLWALENHQMILSKKVK